MEKVSSLWYRILDEKPLPLPHSKARKRRLWFYQSLHLHLLNKLKVCEPEMCSLWSESFPLLHSCKSETSIASLGFTMVEMMNAGILPFSFKNNLFHRIICFQRKLFLKPCQQTTLSSTVLLHVGSGLVAGTLFALGYQQGSVVTVVSGEEEAFAVAHHLSGWSLLVTARVWLDHLKNQPLSLLVLVTTSTYCYYSRKTKVFILRLSLYPEFSLGE